MTGSPRGGAATPAPGRSQLVSVITIFLDAAPFLSEAIESVLSQDYTEWELLLVDDGSTDDGPDIAREYARHRPGQVRYLEHPGHANLGMTASRHLGIQQARGEYVAFLDADDLWMPEKLSRQVDSLSRCADVAMTYGPGLYWYSWTRHAEDLGRDFIQPLAIRQSQVVTPPNLVPGWLRRPFDQPGTSGALVRTGRLRETGPLNDFRGLYEDQVLFCRIALRHSILVSDDCLYKYRQHERSCCSLARRTGIRDRARVTFLRWLDGYLDEERITDRDVRRAVARELRALRPPTALGATCREVARSLLSPPVRHWIRSRLTRSSPGRPGV